MCHLDAAAPDRANTHVVANALKRHAPENDVLVSVSHHQAMIETADTVTTLASK